MKFSEESTFVGLIFGGVTLIAIVAIGVESWGYQQTRTMFEQVYAKNIECRMLAKDKPVAIMDQICGVTPSWEDYK